jgi:hypothetical protein
MNFCIEVVEMHNKSTQIEHMNKLLMSIILQLMNWSIMYLYFTATSQYDMNYMEVTNVMLHRHLETRVILCFVALLCSVNTEIYLASHNKNQEEFLFLYPFQSDSRPPESCSVGSTVSPWGKQPEHQFDDTLVSWSQYLTNLMHKICFTISFISCLYMFRAPCAHHHEVKIALHSLWYHHTYRCGDTRGCVLFHASTCFEHMCSSSGGQNYVTQL